MEQPKISKNSENEEQDWEAVLAGLGMPSEIIPEAQKARAEGVELVSMGTETAGFKAIQEKLQQEDPSNLFGGFSTNMEDLVSLVETLKNEWEGQGISREEISIVIHSSCINGADCVTVIRNGGNKYHYNTKHIPGYSRPRMLARLHSRGLNVAEK